MTPVFPRSPESPRAPLSLLPVAPQLEMSSTHTFEVPPQPFTIAVADAEIADLNARLDSARWPLVDVVQEEEGAEQLGAFGMGYGVSCAFLWATWTALGSGLEPGAGRRQEGLDEAAALGRS